MENVFIIVVILLLVSVGLFSTIRHFRGKGGGCCGGGSYRVKKKRLSHVVAEKAFRVEGMHCENCKTRIEEAINDISGVAGRVDLKKGLLIVSYAKTVDDQVIKGKIERMGYTISDVG